MAKQAESLQAAAEATETRVTAMARALEARVGEIRAAIGEADEKMDLTGSSWKQQADAILATCKK